MDIWVLLGLILLIVLGIFCVVIMITGMAPDGTDVQPFGYKPPPKCSKCGHIDYPPNIGPR